MSASPSDGISHNLGPPVGREAPQHQSHAEIKRDVFGRVIPEKPPLLLTKNTTKPQQMAHEQQKGNSDMKHSAHDQTMDDFDFFGDNMDDIPEDLLADMLDAYKTIQSGRGKNEKLNIEKPPAQISKLTVGKIIGAKPELHPLDEDDDFEDPLFDLVDLNGPNGHSALPDELKAVVQDIKPLSKTQFLQQMFPDIPADMLNEMINIDDDETVDPLSFRTIQRTLQKKPKYNGPSKCKTKDGRELSLDLSKSGRKIIEKTIPFNQTNFQFQPQNQIKPDKEITIRKDGAITIRHNADGTPMPRPLPPGVRPLQPGQPLPQGQPLPPGVKPLQPGQPLPPGVKPLQPGQPLPPGVKPLAAGQPLPPGVKPLQPGQPLPPGVKPLQPGQPLPPGVKPLQPGQPIPRPQGPIQPGQPPQAFPHGPMAPRQPHGPIQPGQPQLNPHGPPQPGRPAPNQSAFGQPHTPLGQKPLPQQSAFGPPQGQQSAFGPPQGQQSAFGPPQGQQSAFGPPQGQQSAFGPKPVGQQSAFGGASNSAFSTPPPGGQSAFESSSGPKPGKLLSGSQSAFDSSSGAPPKYGSLLSGGQSAFDSSSENSPQHSKLLSGSQSAFDSSSPHPPQQFGKPLSGSQSAFDSSSPHPPPHGQTPPPSGQSAFGKPGPIAPGGQSAFGQPVGQGQSAFGKPPGQTAFGQPLAAASSGQSAFGHQPGVQSAFGKLPSAGSAFSSGSSQSTFGQPSPPSSQGGFPVPSGQSAFGQPAPPPPNSQSGLAQQSQGNFAPLPGKSAFAPPPPGKNAFAMPGPAQSGLYHSGSQSSSGQTSSQSAFGQPLPQSAFGQSSPAGAFANAPQPPSGFGNMAMDSNSPGFDSDAVMQSDSGFKSESSPQPPVAYQDTETEDYQSTAEPFQETPRLFQEAPKLFQPAPKLFQAAPKIFTIASPKMFIDAERLLSSSGGRRPQMSQKMKQVQEEKAAVKERGKAKAKKEEVHVDVNESEEPEEKDINKEGEKENEKEKMIEKENEQVKDIDKDDREEKTPEKEINPLEKPTRVTSPVDVQKPSIENQKHVEVLKPEHPTEFHHAPMPDSPLMMNSNKPPSDFALHPGMPFGAPHRGPSAPLEESIQPIHANIPMMTHRFVKPTPDFAAMGMWADPMPRQHRTTIVEDGTLKPSKEVFDRYAGVAPNAFSKASKASEQHRYVEAIHSESPILKPHRPFNPPPPDTISMMLQNKPKPQPERVQRKAIPEGYTAPVPNRRPTVRDPFGSAMIFAGLPMTAFTAIGVLILMKTLFPIL